MAGMKKKSTKKKTVKRAVALSRAERNIAWIERHCKIPEGKHVGKPLKVAQFMRDDFSAIYNNVHGTRRAIISRARKNAKTVEAALIVLLHLAGPEAKVNSQLYSAAQSRDQASLLFNLASKMVRLSPTLRDFITIRESAKSLSCDELGSVYRALSADAPTAFGLSAALLVHDELGQVRGPRSDHYEALETSTAASEDPLSIVISTQAPTDSDLLSILIDDASAGHDPRTVLRLQTAPKDLDTFSLAAIEAANPALNIFMNKTEVLAMAEDARRMPARQSEYENLVLNRRVEANNPFVSEALWKSCGAPVLPFDKDLPVYCGLDLSETADLTAFVAIGRIGGVWHVKCVCWLPGDTILERARADRTPYDRWRDEGYIQAAPGKSVDYSFVAQWLWAEFQRYNIRTVAFDRWNFKHLKPWLLQAGFSEAKIEAHFREFGQGTASMSPALRTLEGEILNGRLAHGSNPVLAMCMANAVVEGGTKDSSVRKLSKRKSAGRIDAAVALAMAIGAAPMDESKPAPQYKIFFV